MPLKIVKDVLVADAGVTALVGTRISPVIAAQNITTPCVVLSVLSVDPVNHLRGYGSLDECRVIVTAWASTYASSLAIGAACRAALEAAGHLCESRSSDEFDPAPDPGLYRVEHQFIVWK